MTRHRVGTLPETNSSPLKMDGWNTTFLLGRPIFRGYVSFRDCSEKYEKKNKWHAAAIMQLDRQSACQQGVQ